MNVSTSAGRRHTSWSLSSFERSALAIEASMAAVSAAGAGAAAAAASGGGASGALASSCDLLPQAATARPIIR
jgi:hypothetical protein